MKLTINNSQEDFEKVAQDLILSKKGEYKYYDLLGEYQKCFDDSVQIVKIHSAFVLAMDDLLTNGQVIYNSDKQNYQNIKKEKVQNDEELEGELL